MLRQLRKKLNYFIKYFLWDKKLELIAFDKKDSNFIRLMNSIKKKTRIWIYFDESYNLYHLMKRNLKLSGYNWCKAYKTEMHDFSGSKV